MRTLEQLAHRNRGPFYTPPDLRANAGTREWGILQSRDACDFHHRSCKDCDFFVNEHCITFSSPTLGSFTWDAKARAIIG